MNKTENYNLILPGENEPVLIEQLNDNFIKIDEVSFNLQDQVEDVIDELKSKVNIEDIDEILDDIPDVFHDVEQNEIKESMTPADFEYGVTLCSQSQVGDFPTINEYGVSYTLIGRHSNYAQIFITRFGDIWSRRATTRSEWNGEWYNAKNEIEKLELELEDLKATSGSQEDINKLEESIKELESKMPETLDDLYVSESWKVPGGQAVHALQNFKADKTDIEKLENNILKIRDDKDKTLRVQVSTTEPPAEDGRIYYNSRDNLFYVARNNQWYRLYVGGDEKLDREPPATAPKLVSKTDTTVTLQSDEDMEFRYQGGSWQEEPFFSNLQRNETYKFEQRYKSDEIYKASPPSPVLTVTTDKGTQTAPGAPRVTNIKFDRVTVTGESNTEVRLNSGTWYSSPHTFTGLNEETKYTAYARRKETNTHKPSPASVGTTFTTPSKNDDKTGSPGSGKLLKGTMEEGYFGSVSSSSLISGNSLASKVGVTQGTSQNSNTPWHKFAYENKILFVAQKTIRRSISWDHLNDKDVVYGNKTIEIDGVKYKVRLLKGALTDPSDYDASDRGAKGSEWNRLMLPLHKERKDNSWGYKEYVEDDLQDWETYLSDSDMVVSRGDGKASWCQETSGGDSDYRVRRGTIGVSSSGTYTSSFPSSELGWRPVLEVVQ